MNDSNYTKIAQVLSDREACMLYDYWIFKEGIGINPALFDYFFFDKNLVREKNQVLLGMIASMTLLGFITFVYFKENLLVFLIITTLFVFFPLKWWKAIKRLEDIMVDALKNKEESVYDNALAQTLSKVAPIVEKNVDSSSMVQIADSIRITGLNLKALSGIHRNFFGMNETSYEQCSFSIKGKDGLLRFNHLLVLDIFFFEDRVCFVESFLNLFYTSVSTASKEWRYDHIAGIHQEENIFVIKNISGDKISLELETHKLKALHVTENSNSCLALKKILREKASKKI